MTRARLTKLQMRIINAILGQGLNDYWYGDGLEAYDDLCHQFNVEEADIEFCIKYIEAKFYFWNC